MKLIAWDTSSKAGTLVALEWTPEISRPALISEWTLNVEAAHSERLLWAIHEMLEAARWRLEEVDCFGVGLGPGSFTGLRIGVTTARTLAHTLQKPLIGVSSLAALARPVAEWFAALQFKPRAAALIVAATDACKGELFSLWGQASSVTQCVVEADGDFPGLWARGVEEQVLTPEELIKKLKKKLTQKKSGNSFNWVVVGEGRKRYLDWWKCLPSNQEIELSHTFQHTVQGRYLGLLVWEAFQAGLGREPLQIHPRYLRVSNAEIKLKNRENRSG